MRPELHVLVVEDDVASCAVLQYILQYHGIKVDIAMTAEQALIYLQKKKYTLAIVDMNLPEMNGWSLLKEIKGNDNMAQQRCIALTAYYDSRVAREAIQAGFEACFPKPIQVSLIQELLQFVS